MKEECGAVAPETKSAGTAYPLKPANIQCESVCLQSRPRSICKCRNYSKLRNHLNLPTHAGDKGNAFRTFLHRANGTKPQALTKIAMWSRVSDCEAHRNLSQRSRSEIFCMGLVDRRSRDIVCGAPLYSGDSIASTVTTAHGLIPDPGVISFHAL